MKKTLFTAALFIMTIIPAASYAQVAPSTVPVPEPGTILLMALGIAGLVGLRRKK